MSENEGNQGQAFQITQEQLEALISSKLEEATAPLLAQIETLQESQPKTLADRVGDILLRVEGSAKAGEEMDFAAIAKEIVGLVQSDEEYTSFINNPLKSEFYQALDQMADAKAGDVVETPIGTFTFRAETRKAKGNEYTVLVADTSMPVTFVRQDTLKGNKQVIVESSLSVSRFKEKVLKFTKHEKARHGGWMATYGSERNG